MRADPSWAEMEKVAHTLAYDGTVMGDTQSGKPLPAGRWGAVAAPTLVIAGGNSEPFFHDAARPWWTCSPARGTAPWTGRTTRWRRMRWLRCWPSSSRPPDRDATTRKETLS